MKETTVPTEEIIIAIPDIHCNKCASNIKTALNYMSGVISAQVDFDNKQAKVIHNPLVVNRNKVVDSIVHLGFQAYLAVVM